MNNIIYLGFTMTLHAYFMALDANFYGDMENEKKI